MSPPTNNWRQRRAEHGFYAEIVKDITTGNPDMLLSQMQYSVYSIVIIYRFNILKSRNLF